MSDVNSALQELEGVNEPVQLPKKKKSYFPGFSGLDSDGKRNMLILISVVIVAAFFVVSSIFSSPPATTQIEETTGDEFANAGISTSGAQVSTATVDPNLVTLAQQADALEAQRAFESNSSGMQNVEYGNWLDVKPEEEKPEAMNPAFARTTSNNTTYNQQGQSEAVKRVSQRIAGELAQANARQFTSTPIQQMQQAQAAQVNTRTMQNQALAQALSDPEADTKKPEESASSNLRHILPGDTLVCQVVKAIDTDVSRETYCVIHGTPLDGGRITLTVKREIDYVYLEGTNLVFQNRFIPLAGAIAVDTGDVAANGLRDDVDYHRLLRFSALMLAGAGSAVTDIAGQPRTRVTTSATQTTVENIKASESEIITAALARPAQIASDSLLEVYKTPPTVYLNKDRIIHMYFSKPVSAPWMPDLRGQTGKNFKYRLY